MTELTININKQDGTSDALIFNDESIARFTARLRGRGTEPAGERDPIIVPEGVNSVTVEGVPLLHSTMYGKTEQAKHLWVTSAPVATVQLEAGQPVTAGDTLVYLEMSVRDNPAPTNKNPEGNHVLRFRLVPNLPTSPASKQTTPYTSLDQIGAL